MAKPEGHWVCSAHDQEIGMITPEKRVARVDVEKFKGCISEDMA